ncbi:hypothetical protein DFJ74DRAFT_243321 [Hyaloraphidium curvatum]|nr:hypothetical protein DFJ74DRAFT_243321 [Hyaloraphidium curvatum]
MAIAPSGYVPPPFPSLTFPLAPASPSQALYYRDDVLSFTVLWTIIWFSLAYVSAGLRAAISLPGKRAPLLAFAFFVLWGLATASVSGAVVGIMLFRVYDAGNFPMATWVPFVWGLIQLLVVLLSSFTSTSLTLL